MQDQGLITTIEEYRSVVLEKVIKDEDIAYLNKSCFGNVKNRPFIVRELKEEKVEIENTSYSGIIQLEKTRIHFSTKVTANLFYMLSFLKDETDFYYDPEKIISIEEGQNFFDILGRLFLNEMEEIFRRGVYKKYVRKEENVFFVKGKILIERHFQNEIRRRCKFFCRYDDLTYDNLENRIILKAATLLAPLIRFNDAIKRSLKRYSNILMNEVALANINPDNCDKIQYNRLNDYYEAIIQLSKAILRFYFIRSIAAGISKGFNFIINMNKVYEDFITEITEELISEDFKQFIVEKQKRFDSLVKEKKILTRPDIIIKRTDKDEHPIIIDAKYKRQENNSDYYQVIAYSLAIPTSKSCFLIYPGKENIETRPLTIDTEKFGNKRDEIKIFSFKVDLWRSPGLSFKDYIREIKDQVKIKLLASGCFN